VRAEVRKYPVDDTTWVKGACKPESKNQEGKPVDPDVHYTARNEKAVDGMKVHVCTDQDSGVIRKMEISHIEKQNHEYLKPMIRHKTKTIFADEVLRIGEKSAMGADPRNCLQWKTSD
jgi:hypothetical protein